MRYVYGRFVHGLGVLVLVDPSLAWTSLALQNFSVNILSSFCTSQTIAGSKLSAHSTLNILELTRLLLEQLELHNVLVIISETLLTKLNLTTDVWLDSENYQMKYQLCPLLIL